MPRSLIGLVIGVPLLAAATLHGQQQAQFLMPMFDEKGVSVATFGPADLAVFEDGKEAKVLKVEPKEAPLRVTLALDNSRAMNPHLVHVRAAARAFFKTLPDGVEASLMTMAPQPRVAVRPTKDRDALLKGVDRVAPDSSSARFVEAVEDLASTWTKQPCDCTPILVALGSTYAEEPLNQKNIENALGQLTRARAVVHVVMFKPVSAGATGDNQYLMGQRFARDTRGRFEEIGSHLQLGILTEIAAEIAKNGVTRQFLVTIERPAGATGRLGSISMTPGNGFMPGRMTRLP